MSDPNDPSSNPYAPPASGEAPSDFGVNWQVDGVDLRVKNGVTLPMVDLQTGLRDENMKAHTHTVKVMTADGALKAALVFGSLLGIRHYFQLEDFGLFIPFLIIMAILYRLGILRKNPNSEIRVVAYVDPWRAGKSTVRRRIRVATFFFLVALIFIPLLFDLGPQGLSGDWLEWVFPTATLGLLGLAIWAVVDQAKPKSKADIPGWLRLLNLHPNALSFLRKIEVENQENAHQEAPRRMRLVRTAYYHRYPLSVLLGKRIYNPLAIFQIGMLKLTRSPLLVRKTYHFSEVEKRSLDELSISIRKQVDDWLSRHQDWVFISGDRLPSPLGDITVDTAILAAPGLDHCVYFTYVWTPIKPYGGVVSVKFLSWSINGTSIWTQDHPYLDLKIPNVEENRASGNPERVFLAHLRNCEGHMIRGPGSAEELLRRIESEKEITDRILTERGYQDEARYSG